MRLREILIFTIFSAALAHTNDPDHSILRITLLNDSQKDDLRGLDRLLGYRIDYLRNVRSSDQPAEMLVKRDELQFVRNYLVSKKIPNKIIIQSVTKAVNRQRRALLEVFNDEITPDLIQKTYLSFDMQMLFLFQLGKRFPNFVNVWQVATSSEGRKIYAIKIGYPSDVNKPILWIDAGIHAREWISHSTALNIISQFVHDSTHKALLREIDIIVVPNVNPDGYEYSRNANRMWRKTRSKSPVSRFSEQCSGVDANRNYPFHFGEEGVSHWPCQEIYCGKMALSEPEILGVTSAIMERKHHIRGYIALHSFGQDILYPWGHKMHEYPEDVEDLISMANGIAAAIRSVYGTRYLVSNSADGLYPASGAADDWAKSVGIKYSFTFELSPTTIEPGFLLPEASISRVSKETMEGVRYMARRLCIEEAGRLFNDIASRHIRQRSRTRIRHRKHFIDTH